MNIVFVTSNGYPIKFDANNTKTELMALGFQSENCSTLMIDVLGGQHNLRSVEEGVSETGVDYVLMPHDKGLLSSFFNAFRMYKLLKIHYKKGEKNVAILSISHYPTFPLMAILTKFAGYKRSALYHEWHVGLEKGSLRKLEASLRVKSFGNFLESILPISHFLEEKCDRFKKPTFLLPILADYSRERPCREIKNQFAICIGASYLLRNQLLFESFRKVHKDYPETKLILVMFGPKSDQEGVKGLLTKYDIDKATDIRTQVPQEVLYQIYDESIGLLIPLDPDNIQDIARFSQKIAEYIGTGRPIITSNVGEIPYYFKDRESAVIVPYSSDGYYEGMKYLIENREDAERIGKKGFDVGKNNFDNKIVMSRLIEFFESENEK